MGGQPPGSKLAAAVFRAREDLWTLESNGEREVSGEAPGLRLALRSSAPDGGRHLRVLSA